MPDRDASRAMVFLILLRAPPPRKERARCRKMGDFLHKPPRSVLPPYSRGDAIQLQSPFSFPYA